MLAVLKKKYDFKFVNEVYKLLLVSLLSLIGCLLCITFIGFPNAYYFEFLIVILTSTYSFYQLNKRMNLVELFNKVKSKIIK